MKNKVNRKKYFLMASLILSATFIAVGFQNCGSPIGSTNSSSGAEGIQNPDGTITPTSVPPGPIVPPPLVCPYTTNAAPVVTAVSEPNVSFKVGMGGTNAGTDATKRITASFTTGDNYSGIVDVNCRVPNNAGVTVNCTIPAGTPSSGNIGIAINAANGAECVSGAITIEIDIDDAIVTAQNIPIGACSNLAKTSARKPFIITQIDGCLPTQRVNPTEPYEAGQMGRTVAIDNDWAVATAPGDEEKAVDAGAAYIMNRTGTAWAITQKLIPSNLASGDLLTTAAISGGTIVLGSPLANGAAGRVWVYQLSGSTWNEVKVINPPAGGDGLFGASLAVSGSALAVGAPRANLGGGLYSGAVFKYSGSGWNTIDVFTPAAGAIARGEYGTSISMSGTTLAVGAPFPAAVSSRDEAVYVYTNTSLLRKILNPGTVANANNRFGFSVAVDGTNLVVGAPYQTNQRGSAYLYKSASGSFPAAPTLQYAIGDPNNADVDHFGYSVAIKGTRVVVGAPDKAELNPKYGAVYLYSTAATTQLFKVRSRLADRGADSFGFSIGVTADGYLASGALNDEHTTQVGNSGSLYFIKLP